MFVSGQVDNSPFFSETTKFISQAQRNMLHVSCYVIITLRHRLPNQFGSSSCKHLGTWRNSPKCQNTHCHRLKIGVMPCLLQLLCKPHQAPFCSSESLSVSDLMEEKPYPRKSCFCICAKCLTFVPARSYSTQLSLPSTFHVKHDTDSTKSPF